MLIDARSVSQQEQLETDICIIGAGAAGITLARQFSGQAFRVSLLESGGLEYDSDTQALYQAENHGLAYFPLETARLRFWGGSTNHWGGVCRPFDELDFVSRPWVPYSGWPIQKTELQAYYSRAQALCQLTTAEWETSYWEAQDQFQALAFPGSRLQTRVAQVVPHAQRSFGKNYLNELQRAPNLSLYLHANVTQLLTDEAGSRVTGVEIACLTGTRFTLQAKVVILATGGIENARLLLLSNRQQPAGLGNQHDLVGRFFLEHPRLVAAQIIPTDPYLGLGFYGPHVVGASMIQSYLALSAETLQQEQLVDVQMDLDAVYDPAYAKALHADGVNSFKAIWERVTDGKPLDHFGQHVGNIVHDLMNWQESTIHVAPLPLPSPEAISKILRTQRAERPRLISEFLGNIALAIYNEIYGGVPLTSIQVTARLEQAPNPQSRVTLSADRDALGLQRTQLDWQLSELDKQSLVRALEILGAELGSAGLGRLQILVDEAESGWPATLRGGWHHMGTTRMSADPRQGVVDATCRVHGLSNLYVTGSSVFPTAGAGTPTLTLVSLALRLADHIQEQMKA